MKPKHRHPPMHPSQQYRRLLALAFLLIAALSALGFRLVDLHVLRHDELQGQAEEKTRRFFIREPRRGDVRDIRGNLLTRSYFVKTVCADPAFIGERHWEVAQILAPLLEMPSVKLDELLSHRFKTNAAGEVLTNHYQVLKNKVSLETWEKIDRTLKAFPARPAGKGSREEQAFYSALRSRAIFTAPKDEQMRVYPNQMLAAHVLGFVGTEERTNALGTVTETVGREGVEFAWNAALSGSPGWRSTEIVHHHELVSARDQDVNPEAGFNVVLTIDAGLQNIVENELAEAVRKNEPVSASALVVRPKTGEIAALASFPTFDPARPGEASPEARRNRVICDVAEPGSTFKIVVVSAALDQHVITLNDLFNCENGRFFYAGRILRDAHPYRTLSAEEIITHSSNIGAAKIGLRLGEQQLYQYIRRFGFGQRTGVGLLGEVSGIVHPVQRWSKLSISRIPMGQEVAVTPLQLMMAMCAIANHGKLMRPYLVDRLEDDNGKIVAQYRPETVRSVLEETTALKMVQALKTVTATNGTAMEARLEHYTVAGKTGTAQKAIRGGYASDKFFSSFIGFFPADNPELCISVVLDEPKHGHYGGRIAGPVFHEIAERSAKYLALRPDLEPSTDLQRAGAAPAMPIITAKAKPSR